jgi:hypothetical protein
MDILTLALLTTFLLALYVTPTTASDDVEPSE